MKKQKIEIKMNIFDYFFFLKIIIEYVSFSELIVNTNAKCNLNTLSRKVKFMKNTPFLVLFSVFKTREKLLSIDCSENNKMNDFLVNFVLLKHLNHLNHFNINYCSNILEIPPFITTIWISKRGCWKIMEFESWIEPDEVVEAVLCGIRSDMNERLKNLFVCWHVGYRDVKWWIEKDEVKYSIENIRFNRTKQLSQVAVKMDTWSLSFLLFRHNNDQCWRIFSLKKMQSKYKDSDLMNNSDMNLTLRKLLTINMCDV